MIRKLAKTAIACAYSWTGVGNSGSPVMPFIVGYHRVVQDFLHSSRNAIPSLLISTAMLEKHLDWLARRFDLVSLDEIGNALESGSGFTRPTAAITFDDGYSDVYHHAFPLLSRKGIPAAVFVVTDLVGTSRTQIYDRLYLLLSRERRGDPFTQMTKLLTTCSQEEVERTIAELEERHRIENSVFDEMRPLNWDMIEEMHRRGITIGSHTRSHVLLTSESLNRVANELNESRKILEERLKAPVKHFAYPDGRFNPAVVQAVAAAGYRFAYGICRARDEQYPLLTIPRKVLWERACMNAFGQFSSSIMTCNTRWVFDHTRVCDHDHVGANGNVAIN